MNDIFEHTGRDLCIKVFFSPHRVTHIPSLAAHAQLLFSAPIIIVVQSQMVPYFLLKVHLLSTDTGYEMTSFTPYVVH